MRFAQPQTNRNMQRFLKWLLILLIGLLAASLLTVKIISDPLPQGESGRAAEALADKVLTAIGNPMLDSVQWLQWEFMRGHRYVWHQPTNTARISWGDHVVVMKLDTQSGSAKCNGVMLQGSDLDQAIAKAWALWCNDSYWLMAPNKLRDPGTQRFLVDVHSEYPGQQGLMVQFSSGGVTPGDTYLWIVGPDGIPSGYKMWVNILPIGGIYASWDNWITVYTGAKLATSHQSKIGGFTMKDVKAGATYQELGLDSNPLEL